VSSMLFVTANAIYTSVALFLMCRTYARRIEDITMTELPPVGTTVLPALSPIDVKSLQYRYTKDAPAVIKDVSLTVMPGETVAIVGQTGSGKSTLAKLMMGLYTPEKGHVHYSGVPVDDIAPSVLFTKLAFVPQDVTLETATIHENVTLGRPVSRAEVEQACRLACVHDDILSFPAGYDTMINNLGANLSGGQRQRIALARSILSKPEILILDEATSSLDTLTEKSVTANLKSLGCTTIIIAHRLASIIDADVTYVLRQGEVVEWGRHDQLMRSEGVYHSLFNGQTQVASH
jgi:ABC-type bacteriocin/lantibiotic exporter with double-glycine peptidase domain